MKNHLLRITSILLLVMLVLALSSCGGKLNGTYVIADKDAAPWNFTVTKLVFKGSNVTVTDLGVQAQCTYSIEGDTLIINGTMTMFGSTVEVDYDYTFRQEGNSIFLDDIKFVKK